MNPGDCALTEWAELTLLIYPFISVSFTTAVSLANSAVLRRILHVLSHMPPNQISHKRVCASGVLRDGENLQTALTHARITTQ